MYMLCYICRLSWCDLDTIDTIDIYVRIPVEQLDCTFYTDEAVE